MKRAPLLLTILIGLALLSFGGLTPAPSRCEPAGRAHIQAILDGIQGQQSRGSRGIFSAFAVRSSDFEHAWMVAAMMTGPGIEEGTGAGVWAITEESPSTILSVNVPAAKFSSYADNFQTDAGVTMEDDGAREAEACALAGVAPMTPEPAER